MTVVTTYFTINHNLLATVVGAALLLTTGIVPMIFEGNQAATAYPMEKRGDYSHGMMKPGQ